MEQLEASIEVVGRRYETSNAATVYPIALKQRRWVAKLMTGHQHPAQRRHLYLVGGQLSGLLGYLALDLGNELVARAYCNEAISLAKAAGHGDLAAWIRGTQSFIAYYGGRYREARGCDGHLNGTVALQLRANRGVPEAGNFAPIIRRATIRRCWPRGMAAQVLRPGGRLAVFWNVGQPPPGLAEAFSAVYRRVLPDASLYHRAMPGLDGHSTLLARAADGIRRSGAFGEPEQWLFDREQSYTRDEWLDQVPTFGGHSTFPPATLARPRATVSVQNGVRDSVTEVGAVSWT
ncbi:MULTISPECIES: hypothetical protein [Frankia]|uniref:hypothetical protein n=1 Tax=Frankia TaxID=1854 RepID=UPI001E42CD1E|nr:MULTISPECIES: hypothetical protein [Frankia]